ncbi:MAG: HAMP domain-containing sensor histidine kinase [Rikenellaceae bacterium]
MMNSSVEWNINLWSIKRLWANYRYLIAIAVGGVLTGLAIFKSAQVAATLYERELRFTAEWRAKMTELQFEVASSSAPVVMDFERINPNIPYVMVDVNRQVVASNIFDVYENDFSLTTLNSKISELAQANEPVLFSNLWREERYILFYGRSVVLEQLQMIPLLQIVVALVYLFISFLMIGLSRQAEHNRMWVGLAKETAHQLGTPTSSLMGWLEYLRDSGVALEAVGEMKRDLARLKSVSERFSKIGSDTALEAMPINGVMQEVVHYFRPRIPKGVALLYESGVPEEMVVEINKTLFDWVIENLLKNALDAMSGEGSIVVSLRENRGKITIDVKDSGRGVERGSWRKIFEPGYTTKQRGWGLGLSLSRRIVEDYHGGTIGVVESAPGEGTTVRVQLKQLC